MLEDVPGLVDLLLEAAVLKWTARTGWRMRGVQDPESVAEHSFGVGLVALTMADLLAADAGGPDLDVGRLLQIALLHDLGEARLTDLPASAVQLLGSDAKRSAEVAAMQPLLSVLPSRARLEAAWLEFEDASTPEGRLVRDADKVEMMVQCLRYELAGSRGLGEFWQAMDRHAWHYPLSGRIYARLKELRPGGGDDR
ncbi:MAG TPA: HD family hydrolase [Anaerolineae bacterium]|nr:HD family hydrolase [Anaerolineae bacterium]